MGDPGPLLCGALCLVGSALLAAPSHRLRRILLIAWAAITLLICLLPSTSRLAQQGEVREYTFAHYHLGARYFAELGYEGLYAQAAAAEAIDDIAVVRDLSSYELVRAPAERSSRWTDARWEAFTADLAALKPRQSTRSWTSWFKDKGYNATPAWTATWGRLLGARPAGDAWFTAMGTLDLAFLIVSLLVAGRVFGALPAVVLGAVIALFYGSAQNLVAGPLTLDWLAASILCACALQRGHLASAGALLGWAVLSRVFPVLLVVGPLWAAWRSPSLRPSMRRFSLGLGLMMLVGLGLGATTSRGPAAWGEFTAKIATHSELHHQGDRRIGLRPIVAWTAVGERTDAEARAHRAERWPARRPFALLAAGLFAGLWLWLLARGLGRLEGMQPGRAVLVLLGLSLPLCFVLVTLSRYYQLLPALGLLLLPREGGTTARLAALLLASFGIAWFGVQTLPDATAYLLANGLWGLVGAVMMVRWARTIRPR